MSDKKNELEAKMAEQARHLAHVETKYEHLRQRYHSLQSRTTWVFRHPIRHLLAQWYHRYIKRDRLI